MRPPDRHPLVIAGGSLAGMAAAIRLHQLGLEPLVLDKSRFPRPKLCGEFLVPDAFPLLDQLGAWEAVRNQATRPVRRAWFFNPSGQALAVEMDWLSHKHPYGIAIPRETLDALLVELASQRGIPIRQGCRVVSAVRENGRFRLQLQSGQEPGALETPVLVDATGRSGGLMPETDTARRHPDKVGIQCHVRLSVPLADTDLRMYLFEGGYGGIQPLNDATANLCMLASRQDARAMHEDFGRFIEATIGRNPAAMELLRGASPAGPFATTANINLDLGAPREDLLRIGDAMVTVDPFTGSGMAHALETGVMAAEHLASGLKRGDSYDAINRRYRIAYARRHGYRLGLLKRFRPLMHAAHRHAFVWPLLRPVMPVLAKVFR